MCVNGGSSSGVTIIIHNTDLNVNTFELAAERSASRSGGGRHVFCLITHAPFDSSGFGTGAVRYMLNSDVNTHAEE